MKKLFSTNAYYILGLPVSSDQSEIKKKYRLLSAQLGIDEKTLQSDFPIIEVNRTEDLLKESVQLLSNPTKKLQEVYLWFSDESSSEIVNVLSKGKVDEAFEYLSKRSGQDGKWNAKRDFALYLTMLLFHNKSEKKHLSKSLDLWKELVTSESAWKYFCMYYKNIDDLHTDITDTTTLKKWANESISDIYTQLSEKWDDSEYTLHYTKAFGKVGTHLFKSILAPQIKLVNEAIIELESIGWHEKSPTKKNLADLKMGIAKIQGSFNELIDHGLYDIDDVITLRDKASDAIRESALVFTNRYDDYERSAQILAISEELSGTKSTKNKNQIDRSTVEDSRDAQKFLIPILDLINKGKYLKAVEYVEEQIELNKKSPKRVKLLEKQLPSVISRYIVETRSEAMEMIKNGKFAEAINEFESLRVYIVENLDYFDLVTDKVANMVDGIDERTNYVNPAIFDELSKERDDMVTKLFEKLGETSSASVLMCLLDCAYFVPLGGYLKKVTSKNEKLGWLFNLGWWTILIYGAGLLFLIPAYIWQRKEVVYVRE